MKTLRFSIVAGLVAAIALVSCQDSFNDLIGRGKQNPLYPDVTITQGVSIRMKAVSTQHIIAPKVNGRSMATGLTFTRILLGLEELELENELPDSLEHEGDEHDGRIMHSDSTTHEGDDDEDDHHLEIHGAYVLDLIAGTSTPALDTAVLDSGAYNEIKLKLGQVLDSGNSIFIAFTADSASYELSTREHIQLKFKIENGFSVQSDSLNFLSMQLDLDALFSNLDLSAAEADADGVIRINDERNQEILREFLQALGGSCRSHEGREDDEDEHHEG